MAMNFSHAVGYRGIAAVGECDTNNGQDTLTSSSFVTVLCTGGSLSFNQDPIMSGGVWGAGYSNAAPIAYAFNYLSMEGSVNFEWVLKSNISNDPNDDKVWKALKKFAITDRTKKAGIKLLPDGSNGFLGGGWCSSLSFEASEGAALTGSFNFKGDPSATTVGNDNNSPIIVNKKLSTSVDTIPNESKGNWSSSSKPNSSGIVGAVLVPYWQTSVYWFTPTSTFEIPDDLPPDATQLNNHSTDVINWSCSYNSDLQVLKCCNYQSTPPIAPDYILCGEMSGEASVTTFNKSGISVNSGFHEQEGIAFYIGKKRRVVLPLVLCSSKSTSMATGSSYLTCDSSYTALGNGYDSILSMN